MSSLLSALLASVSGMNAQANNLSTISDNIANANTVGYKEASTEFEAMLSSVSSNNYNAGGVGTSTRFNIDTQGSETSTTNSTDMEIQGNGFFVVQNSAGATLLTRAGSFTQNSSGQLVNTAGYVLMGQPITGGNENSVINGVNQLEPISINPVALVANASTSGTFVANLNSNATVVTGDTAGSNAADATSTSQTTMTAFDNQGNQVNLDVYFTKTSNNGWEVAVYNHADAGTGSTAPFPYTPSSPTDTEPMTTQNLSFDPTTGALTSPSPPTLSINIPNGQTLNVDMSGMTQLASTFAVSNNTINGNAPATFQSVSVSTDGIVNEVYSNGAQVPVFKIPLATVASVNSLTPVAGDAYQTNDQSGSIVVGGANEGGFGSVNGNELESSTVDLASELTNMVVAQNSYSANSKVFQVGSELLQELTNLVK